MLNARILLDRYEHRRGRQHSCAGKLQLLAEEAVDRIAFRWRAGVAVCLQRRLFGRADVHVRDVSLLAVGQRQGAMDVRLENSALEDDGERKKA